MKKIIKISSLFLLAGLSKQLLAQQPGDTASLREKIVVSANADYNKAGKLKRLLFGEHYRKEWAILVELRELDIDSFAGGLTPTRLGGGKQTKSLRLENAEGKEFVLRSVNKDPSKAIPEEYAGTFVNDVVQDQISSSNPYAPMVVASLSEAAGIYHGWPIMVYVKPSPRLGIFAPIFANTICLLEERPIGNQEDNPLVDHSKKVVNSQKLFEDVFSNGNHRVDEKAFLKARLFDMWIGDWDRHEDQWTWASFKEGNKIIYKPIPRDRDQAFSNLDGILPQMASRPWLVRKTQNFDYTIRDINGLNMAGGFLDRQFITQLNLNDWLEVVSDLQKRLTDERIETAFASMPKKIFDVSGKEIIAKLKKRRDDLKKYATTYYYFLSKDVNIIGTNKPEFFDVNRINDDSTLVTMYSLNKAEQKTGIIYQRSFTKQETKEIRLYGLGGNDKFNIDGQTKKAILIRVIGGDGNDSVVDNSSVKGANRQTRVYDSSIYVVNTKKEAKIFLSNDTVKNNFHRLGYRYDWLSPTYVPGYNPDDGIYIGGGIIFKKQQFGKSPFGYMQTIWGNYAFETGAYNFGYEGIFREAIGKWDLHLNARVNAPNYVINYFGMGNDTKLMTDNKNFNRVRSNQILFSSTIDKHLGKHQLIRMGLNYQSIKIERNEGRFITDIHSKLDSSIFDRKYYAGAMLGYEFNTLDHELFPKKGFRTSATLEYVQNLQNRNTQFGRFSAMSEYYVSAGILTAAFRLGGAVNIGNDYEFFQANTLGGTTNLRGYRRSRFAGKSDLYQNTELRLKLKTLHGYWLRGNIGVLAFLDHGRVWMPDEQSNTWHVGYGGGIWYLPYNMMVLTATFSSSKEMNLFAIKAGFLF